MGICAGTRESLGLRARLAPARCKRFCLLVVWIHGCLEGVHFWLRLKPFYLRVKELLLSIAVLPLPTLALLGYLSRAAGGRDCYRFQDPAAWLARNVLARTRPGHLLRTRSLLDERTRTLAFLAAALAATLSCQGASDSGRRAPSLGSS